MNSQLHGIVVQVSILGVFGVCALNVAESVLHRPQIDLQDLHPSPVHLHPWRYHALHRAFLLSYGFQLHLHHIGSDIGRLPRDHCAYTGSL